MKKHSYARDFFSFLQVRHDTTPLQTSRQENRHGHHGTGIQDSQEFGHGSGRTGASGQLQQNDGILRRWHAAFHETEECNNGLGPSIHPRQALQDGGDAQGENG